jgi:hypothetical protein
VAEKRPTILQIIPELDTGGAELSTIEIAGAIEGAGGRAIVLSEGGRLVQRLRDTGAELHFFPAAAKSPIRLLWNAHRIADLIRRERVDLVHARSRAPAWSALMAARRTHVPFVTTYHGAYSEKSALKRLYNSVMARGDLVIANSHYTADLIRMRYGTPLSRLHVIYRGQDAVLFDPDRIAPERVAALRQQWGVAGETRVVLQAARLTGWKGQSVLIEATRILMTQGRLGDTVVVPMLERRNHDQTFLGHDLLRPGSPVHRGGPREHHLAALFLDAFDLDPGRGLRHHDYRPDAEQVRRVGDGQSVVTAGVGDDAPAPHFRSQPRNGGVGTPNLESTDRLQVLALEQHLEAQLLREPRRLAQWRSHDHARQERGRVADVLE